MKIEFRDSGHALRNEILVNQGKKNTESINFR